MILSGLPPNQENRENREFCHLLLLAWKMPGVCKHKHCDFKPNWPGISLLLPENNLENTWNFVSWEKCEPCIIYLGLHLMASAIWRNLYLSNSLIDKIITHSEGISSNTCHDTMTYINGKTCLRSYLASSFLPSKEFQIWPADHEWHFYLETHHTYWKGQDLKNKKMIFEKSWFNVDILGHP